ncbi:MAG: Mth938-like domain-containing protein [Burkholderiaceae bacterium]|jgi:uncharacterized protein|nr:Mth938-like domain-containing protein [Burkholderiaceae bacterium]
MKFQSDVTSATSIRAYGPGWIMLAGAPASERIRHNVILSADGIERWDVACFDDLNASHFATLAARKPELVLFGSGARQRFPKPVWVRALIDAGIGIETMDTPAACRTWNVLIGEGRRVLSALLIEGDG